MILWMSAMMFISMIVIQVFVMPYIMTEIPAHVFYSVSQAYMGAFMGAAMIAVMGLTHSLPWWLWLLSIAVMILSVLGYRWQIGITDKQYLCDMIPHHSMAILTSAPRMTSLNPLIQRLAEQITATQRREIADMKLWLTQQP